MKRFFIFNFVALAVFLLNSEAQSQGKCPQELASTYAEFTTDEDLSARLEGFKGSLTQSKSPLGFVLVFGGSKSRIDEIDIMRKRVESMITKPVAKSGPEIHVLNAGYRKTATLVFVDNSSKCARLNFPVADLTIDQVEFDGFSPAESVRQSGDELRLAAIEKPDVVCPPAARALHVCELTVDVFILVDTKGAVVLAGAVSGHPLLRAAAHANVRSWKFAPLRQDDKELKRTGTVTIRFQKPKDIDY